MTNSSQLLIVIGNPIDTDRRTYHSILRENLYSYSYVSNNFWLSKSMERLCGSRLITDNFKTISKGHVKLALSELSPQYIALGRHSLPHIEDDTTCTIYQVHGKLDVERIRTTTISLLPDIVEKYIAQSKGKVKVRKDYKVAVLTEAKERKIIALLVSKHIESILKETQSGGLILQEAPLEKDTSYALWIKGTKYVCLDSELESTTASTNVIKPKPKPLNTLEKVKRILFKTNYRN